ncbi:MAG: tRNA pseudouridine(55) synthase TruB, partial [Clostridiales Family XIII bacterium]|nr:tRNA pseudouridine(55) synthase TruB [Clostridiales Family XIII bacterium]
MNRETGGLLNFLKPSGMTSHDAVSFLRRLTGVKRIGHMGTLDPMAAGVLPLCIGRATRIAEYLVFDTKEYRCEMRLGLKTDTLDIWGTTVWEAEPCHLLHLDEARIREQANVFTGEQMQTPPAYSAIKISGKKLYEYAREGQPVQVPARKIDIKSITVYEVDLEERRLVFDVVCSKGTYIRSLCHDMGEALGCGAVMSHLIRTRSGCFQISDA